MELAKITSVGQITIPASIKRKLKLNNGDKIAFIEKDGYIVVANPAILSLENVQKAKAYDLEQLRKKIEENSGSDDWSKHIKEKWAKKDKENK